MGIDPNTLALGAAFIISLTWAVYQLGKPAPLPGIPHNSNLSWFAGDIPFIARGMKERGSSSIAFEDTAKRLGPIVLGPGASWASRLGIGRVIVTIADAQEIQDILTNRMAEFGHSRSARAQFEATVPHGLVALPSNDEYRHHKRYLAMTMTTPYLARMIPRMAELVQEIIDLWSLGSKRLSGPSDAISALDDIRCATLDIIASITFGASVNAGKAAHEYLEAHPEAPPDARPAPPRLVADLQVLLDTLAKGVLFPIPTLVPWITRAFNRKWRASLNRTHAFLKGRLSAARAEYMLDERDASRPAPSEANNVLDMIFEKERADELRGAEALSEAEIIDELLVYALAGSETTATAMQWGLKILCKHPDVQRALHAELLTLPSVCAGAPTFAEIGDDTKSPYLAAFVHELLRCSRTAAACTRDTTCDTVVFGHPIPKGTQVVFTLAMAQQYETCVPKSLGAVRSATSRRRMGFWDAEDVAEFKPERWLRADGSFDVNAGPYMPFSFGPRGCFGQKLAVTELRLFFAMVQMAFFFDEVPAELNSWRAEEAITNHPLQCFVRPIIWEEAEKLGKI
ncbi:Cytochrome P450 [Mycena kentingensis (nom. inval.)]|nr:Cytochrome P450 [Mycena kentingensis (nom. inval.)]